MTTIITLSRNPWVRHVATEVGLLVAREAVRALTRERSTNSATSPT